MGVIDTEGKNYFLNHLIFADAFNFLLYGGKQVINPNELKELDTTLVSIPYGNNARVPVQKYRDLLKLWCAMMDDNAVYLMLGAELQDKVHYAMPVKSGLYDMLGYARQVEEARRSYKKKGNEKGDMYIEDDKLKINLTSEEFLSGFRKEDKLIPIITLVVYLSSEVWEAPLSLHEMLDVNDKGLLKFIPDYSINLICPANIVDTDFDKFNTDLGLALKVIKYQETTADKIIEDTDHRKIDRNTAVFLNKVASLDLVFDEKEGDVDMCKAMENRYKQKEVLGAIKLMKADGKSEKEIVDKIVNTFEVTKEYVEELLAPKAV